MSNRPKSPADLSPEELEGLKRFAAVMRIVEDEYEHAYEAMLPMYKVVVEGTIKKCRERISSELGDAPVPRMPAPAETAAVLALVNAVSTLLGILAANAMLFGVSPALLMKEIAGAITLGMKGTLSDHEKMCPGCGSGRVVANLARALSVAHNAPPEEVPFVAAVNEFVRVLTNESFGYDVIVGQTLVKQDDSFPVAESVDKSKVN